MVFPFEIRLGMPALSSGEAPRGGETYEQQPQASAKLGDTVLSIAE